jgi:hypothetical protein
VCESERDGADLLIPLHLSFYSSQAISQFGCNSNFAPDATSHALAVAEGELSVRLDFRMAHDMDVNETYAQMAHRRSNVQKSKCMVVLKFDTLNC